MAKNTYPEWMGKMRALSNEEIEAFLAGPIVARLATIQADGSPYIAPVWQEYDGQAVYFIPREKSAFVQHIIRDPRISISCALDEAPSTRVLFQGRAEILEGPAPLAGRSLEIARRMATRYLGERGPDYLEPTIPRPRYLIRLIPEKTVSWEGVWLAPENTCRSVIIFPESFANNQKRAYNRARCH